MALSPEPLAVMESPKTIFSGDREAIMSLQTGSTAPVEHRLRSLLLCMGGGVGLATLSDTLGFLVRLLLESDGIHLLTIALYLPLAVAGAWFCWRFVSRPGRRRLHWISFLVVTIATFLGSGLLVGYHAFALVLSSTGAGGHPRFLGMVSLEWHLWMGFLGGTIGTLCLLLVTLFLRRESKWPVPVP